MTALTTVFIFLNLNRWPDTRSDFCLLTNRGFVIVTVWDSQPIWELSGLAPALECSLSSLESDCSLCPYLYSRILNLYCSKSSYVLSKLFCLYKFLRTCSNELLFQAHHSTPHPRNINLPTNNYKHTFYWKWFCGLFSFQNTWKWQTSFQRKNIVTPLFLGFTL